MPEDVDEFQPVPDSFLSEFDLFVVECPETQLYYVVGHNNDIAWVLLSPTRVVTAGETAHQVTRRLGHEVCVIARENLRPPLTPVFQRALVREFPQGLLVVPSQQSGLEMDGQAVVFSFLLNFRVWPEAADRLNRDRQALGLPVIRPSEA